MLLPVHIVGGGLAIVLGAVALSVKRGGTIHRRAGLLFVGTMLVTAASASILGCRKGPTDSNVFAVLMILCFVGTLTTVRAFRHGLDVSHLPCWAPSLDG